MVVGSKVLATGIFDLLHIGHVYFLNQAKKLGDHLTVLITCDRVASSQKRKPIYNESERKKLIDSLKVVDASIIGNESVDYCRTLNELQPDILALGFDQDFQIRNKLKNCHWNGKIVRVGKYPNKTQSTTNIIRKVSQSLKLKSQN